MKEERGNNVKNFDWRHWSNIAVTIIFFMAALFIWKGSIDARIDNIERFERSIKDLPIVMQEVSTITQTIKDVTDDMIQHIDSLDSRVSKIERSIAIIDERTCTLRDRLNLVVGKLEKLKERVDKSNINGKDYK